MFLRVFRKGNVLKCWHLVLQACISLLPLLDRPHLGGPNMRLWHAGHSIAIAESGASLLSGIVSNTEMACRDEAATSHDHKMRQAKSSPRLLDTCQCCDVLATGFPSTRSRQSYPTQQITKSFNNLTRLCKPQTSEK